VGKTQARTIFPERNEYTVLAQVVVLSETDAIAMSETFNKQEATPALRGSKGDSRVRSDLAT